MGWVKGKLTCLFPNDCNVEAPTMKLKKLPRHVGLIPDGNRRWATARGLLPQQGYQEGVVCGLKMLVWTCPSKR